jgi:hypothetical protein
LRIGGGSRRPHPNALGQHRPQDLAERRAVSVRNLSREREVVIEDQARLIDDAVDRADLRELGLLRSLDDVTEDRPLAERDLNPYAGKHELGQVVGDGVRVCVPGQL